MRPALFAAMLSLAPLLLASCNNSATGAPTKTQAKTERTAQRTTEKPGTVVVELFQSQGCSSCPPANAALNAIADRGDVIALSYAVTYWDRLGWKDRFADPAFTQRQYDYKAALKANSVYTPQVVLNGTRAIVGNGQGELARAVAVTDPVSSGPSIAVAGDQIEIGAGKGKASIWLIRYDPRFQNVAIGAGENKGRTLPHRNIVRQLVKLGSWSGKAASFTLPAAKIAGLRSVVLVQQGTAGPIMAAKRL
jgi:hypothetical protein